MGGVNPHELIRKLINESKPEGGSIFLDDFCKMVPDVSRAECVMALKNNKDVLFIVGRKGHMSRAVFGKMKESYNEAPSFRSPLASGPIRLHAPQRHIQSHQPQTSRSAVDKGTEIDASTFKLRVVVQGQEIFIPIDEFELVPA